MAGTKNIRGLKIGKKEIRGFEWPPVIVETASDSFEIPALSSDNKTKVYIFSDGKTGQIRLVNS